MELWVFHVTVLKGKGQRTLLREVCWMRGEDPCIMYQFLENKGCMYKWQNSIYIHFAHNIYIVFKNELQNVWLNLISNVFCSSRLCRLLCSHSHLYFMVPALTLHLSKPLPVLTTVGINQKNNYVDEITGWFPLFIPRLRDYSSFSFTFLCWGLFI